MAEDMDEDPEPWRKSPDWNRNTLEELKGNIVNYKPSENTEITSTRMLMIGPVGAGKSSFYNTIDSIFRGRITQLASVGSTDVSLTKNYATYAIRNENGQPLNFHLCDTPGIEEANGLKKHEYEYLLNGNIRNHYEFKPGTPISPQTRGFIGLPSANDIVHCVIFVMDATTLDAISGDLIEKMKLFQKLANDKVIPRAIVLTKVDKLCKDVKKDISFVYSSPIVEQHVDKAAELLGVSRGNVFPLKNYENELQLDDNISILALLALRQMLNFTEDYTRSRLEQKKAADELKELDTACTII